MFKIAGNIISLLTKKIPHAHTTSVDIVYAQGFVLVDSSFGRQRQRPLGRQLEQLLARGLREVALLGAELQERPALAGARLHHALAALPLARRGLTQLPDALERRDHDRAPQAVAAGGAALDAVHGADDEGLLDLVLGRAPLLEGNERQLLIIEASRDRRGREGLRPLVALAQPTRDDASRIDCRQHVRERHRLRLDHHQQHVLVGRALIDDRLREAVTVAEIRGAEAVPRLGRLDALIGHFGLLRAGEVCIFLKGPPKEEVR